MITRSDVEKISRLCRIALNDVERASLERELSAILEFAEKLEKAGAETAEPLTGEESALEALREDVVASRNPEDDEDGALIDQAPAVRNGFVEVRAVFDREG